MAKFPRVIVHGFDYTYEGTIVSVFMKRSRHLRIVVEDDNGRLFIHNAQNIHMSEPALEAAWGEFLTAEIDKHGKA